MPWGYHSLVPARRAVAQTRPRVRIHARSVAHAIRHARNHAALLVVLGACGSSHAKLPNSDPDSGAAAVGAQGGTHSTTGGKGGRSAAGQRGDGDGDGRGDAGDTGHAGTGSTSDAGGDGAGGAEPEFGGASGEAGSNGGCDFKVNWSISENIPTVASVEWTSALSELRDASIQFGLDANYGMTAPVDLTAPSYRTLLIGMKPARAYHFRIVAHGRTRTCTSDDATLATGPALNGLPALTISDHGSEHFAGLLLSSFITSGPAFMLDADGEYVWAYGTGEMGRAALSHDGKYVWYGAVNVAGTTPSMKRVTLDGLEETDFTAEFFGLHHDFTLLPDDTIAFLAHHDDSDVVLEHAQDGTVRQVLDVGMVLGSTHTHANSIHYHLADDTYTLGELAHDSFIKFDRAGHVIWILGGEKSDFSGDGASWDGQHGHELLAPDRLLFFSNGAAVGGTSSALEIQVDLDAATATRVWQYQPGPHCLIYGDVARLDSENTLVTFSTLGVIHEVTPDGSLVRELTWSLGGALGYVTPLTTPYPPLE